MADPIIITRNLAHSYGAGPLQRPALVDVSLEIERGSCAAIIGVTGSGKTTLVQHFNRLLRPTAGSVLVDGIDVNAKGVDLRDLRQRVGMLFQFPERQLFERTVFADVVFGPQRLGLSGPEVRGRVRAALDIVGLPHREYARRSPFELSGGQMRRVALAGVLAMRPEVLILDEPTASLDADARAEFYYYLRRVQMERGVTVVLVSHNMAEVANLADYLFVLHTGRLAIQGTPRQVFARGEELRQYGLAVPPLIELLALLRQGGLDIPKEVLSLEEASTLLREKLTR